MESSTLTTKDEFTNRSSGQCGVVIVDNHKEKGIAVRPGETILLSELEQTLTANAHRRNEDNPFINGTLELTTPAAEMRHRRPIGRDMAAGANGGATAAVPQAEAQARKAAADKAAHEAERAARVKAEQERAQKQATQADRPLPPKPSEAKGAEGKVAEETAAAGAAENEETGAAAQPAGEAAQGQRAPKEEVGTPEAPRQAKS